MRSIKMLLLSLLFAVSIPFLSMNAGAAEITDGTTEELPVVTEKPSIEISGTSYTYTGNAQYPDVTVKDANGIIIDSSEYEVTYPAGSKAVGKYTLSVNFSEGSYAGTYKKNYKIVPAKAKIVRITPSVKGFHIKWKKNTDYVTGYQVSYAKKSDFSDETKKSFNGENKTLGIIKKLHSHATYYVRLRRYYKTGGETFFSPWTSVEEVYTRRYSDNYKSLKSAETVSGFQYINTEKKLSSSTKAALDKAVSTILNKGYSVSFVLMDLDTGEGIARNIDNTFNAASTIKGPYVCAITSQKPALARKYRSTITKTIVNSDNGCYLSLRNIFGQAPLRTYVKEAHTSIPLSTWTRYSVRKLGMLWIRNWEFFESGTEDAKWTKKTFDHSYMAFINEQLAGDDVKVYSKPGWLYYKGPVAQHDAGVVEKANGHTYLMVVLSNAYGQRPSLRKLAAALDKCEDDLQKK